MKLTFRTASILLGAWVLSLSIAQAAPATSACVIAGPPDAALTIEEYSDFQCPYCAKGSEVVKQALKEYPGKIRLVFRNLPLPFHKHALTAAKAFTSVCLQDPSLAYSYQNTIFENQDKLATGGESYLLEVAQKLGVDMNKMKSDMASTKVEQIIANDQALAKTNNFQGTPSFMVGKEPLVGARPYKEFREVIERNLKY